MEVNSVKTMNTSAYGYSSGNSQSGVVSSQEAREFAFSTTTASSTDIIGNSKQEIEQPISAQAAYLEAAKKLSKEDVSEISRELSRFMELLNADIRFSLHEKSQRLIVQVVDIKQNKVLKEFPPHELLDTMAKIHEYVGILLDKKA